MKTVLITGCASGFGKLAAIQFAKSGYIVIATMRDISKCGGLEEDARKENVLERIHFIQMDVTSPNQIEEAFQKVKALVSQIDCLVNNAGFCQGGFFEDLSEQEWQNQINTNLLGVIRVTKTFLPLLRKSDSAKIINISSVSGIFGFPGLSAYTTSKFALEGLSESLRLELLNEKISVVLIEPASFNTSIWEKSFRDVQIQENHSDYQKNVYKSALNSMKSSGDPNLVANLIVQISNKKKPEFRYPIGKGARLLSLAKRFIPWSIIEMVVKRKLSK